MPTKMISVEPSPALIAYVEDLKAVIARHQQLSPMEMLAGASQLVGTLVALQDQRTVTPSMAMELVGQNIEAGNAEAIKPLLGAAGQA